MLKGSSAPHAGLEPTLLRSCSTGHHQIWDQVPNAETCRDLTQTPGFGTQICFQVFSLLLNPPWVFKNLLRTMPSSEPSSQMVEKTAHKNMKCARKKQATWLIPQIFWSSV